MRENRFSDGLLLTFGTQFAQIGLNLRMMPFYVLQFCIHANFLSVQSLRHYEFFKK